MLNKKYELNNLVVVESMKSAKDFKIKNLLLNKDYIVKDEEKHIAAPKINHLGQSYFQDIVTGHKYLNIENEHDLKPYHNYRKKVCNLSDIYPNSTLKYIENQLTKKQIIATNKAINGKDVKLLYDFLNKKDFYKIVKTLYKNGYSKEEIKNELQNFFVDNANFNQVIESNRVNTAKKFMDQMLHLKIKTLKINNI